ncbi:hypothetical protein HJG43_08015 [Kineosporiaceae bacterium SCSIO 59966]|nr:hypothetical protein HJG43_08015 [Kineosporiaceae bacterium SCSIO 59966]
MTVPGSRVPDGLPRLLRGSHDNPTEGACFMEYASVLAGEPFSDQPRCTHPLLAELARMVNDMTSDAARAGLVPLVPRVVGCTTDDPACAPRLVLDLLTLASRHGLRGTVLEWHQARAARRLQVVRRRRPVGRPVGGLVTGVRRLRDVLYSEGPAVRAVSAVGCAAATLSPARRDAVLAELLECGIRTVAEVRDAAQPAGSTGGSGFTAGPWSTAPVGSNREP